MSDPFNTPKIIEMFKALRLPMWQAALTKAVAADLAHIPAGPDSTRCAENGVDHEEVRFHLLTRAQDTAAIANEVVEGMRYQIAVCLARFRNNGLIYWRIRPEMHVEQVFTSKHYYAAGAHYDALHDKKFDGDGDWLRISAYARLSRSEPAAEPVHSVVTAIDALHSARRT